MSAIIITAKRWSGGWELWQGDDCWTQVRTLAKARQQVVDYLDTIEGGVDHANLEIQVVPELGDLGVAVERARAATSQAQVATMTAAQESRQVAHRLRAAGFSVTDSAEILGVSRGRVSQLVSS